MIPIYVCLPDSMENQTTLPSTRGDTGEHPHEEESTIRQVTERGLDINQGDITLEKPGVTSLNESREPQNDGNRREVSSFKAALNLLNCSNYYCIFCLILIFLSPVN